jgi:hypothetical protein
VSWCKKLVAEARESSGTKSKRERPQLEASIKQRLFETLTHSEP